MSDEELFRVRSGICHRCGYNCSGDIVRRVALYDRRLGRTFEAYEHPYPIGCQRAKERSDAFWSGDKQQATP